MDPSMVEKGNWQSFLSLPNEKILLVKRSSLFVLVPPLFLISLLTLAILGYFLVFFLTNPLTFWISLASCMTLSLIILSITTGIIIDWYFHIYILTSERILEVFYIPLSSHVINDILLDQVKCTEIDWRIGGIINELVDMGDVVLTFDRPTHQKEFVIKNVSGCKSLSAYLTQQLILQKQPMPTLPLWYKNKAKSDNFTYIEEGVFP